MNIVKAAVLGIPSLLLILDCGGARPAIAHGGVSMEKDVCKLRAGPYMMHFTGYQPAKQGNQEFCEDIPEIGRTVIVLDAVGDVLRDLPIEVQLLRDAGNDVDSEAVLRIPPKQYPTGSLSFQYTFPESGRFVGLVTVGDGPKYVSRFPFSVGYGNGIWVRYRDSFAIVLGTLAAGAALFWYSTLRKES